MRPGIWDAQKFDWRIGASFSKEQCAASILEFCDLHCSLSQPPGHGAGILCMTYSGLRNPTPVDRWFIPLFNTIYRVSTIEGGAGFRNHPQYDNTSFDVCVVLRELKTDFCVCVCKCTHAHCTCMSICLHTYAWYMYCCIWHMYRRVSIDGWQSLAGHGGAGATHLVIIHRAFRIWQEL
jgi:hypothetical protein